MRSTVHKAATAALIAAMSLGALGAAAPARANSAFGCKNLEHNPVLPSVEGKNGFFFRVFADLRMQHPMTDVVVQQMRRLSEALAAHGTTLIYLPIPTKSQTIPSQLPKDVSQYGFNKKIADLVYEDQIKRLNANGVIAVDLLSALKSDDPKHPPFFKADFHWTSLGAKEAARAIAAVVKKRPEYANLDQISFKTTPVGREKAVSGMRRALQTFCKDSLPPVVTNGFETVQVQKASKSLDIFGSKTSGADIALVGTSFSDAEVPNFGGFLSQYTDLGVDNLAITGGNQFGAVTSYLTSNLFQKERPRFLIWENPIYNNLAQYGAQPMLELIAAARENCTPVSADRMSTKADDKNAVTVDLAGMQLDRNAMVLADAGTEISRQVTMAVQWQDGRTFKEMVKRTKRMRGTGRFYVSARPLWSPHLSKMTLTFDRRAPDATKVSICSLKKKG